MVVFVDYERDSYDDVQHRHPGSILHPYPNKGSLSVVKTHTEQSLNSPHELLNGIDRDEESLETRDALNLDAFSRCLACYPYEPPRLGCFWLLYITNFYQRSKGASTISRSKHPRRSFQDLSTNQSQSNTI